MKKCSTCKTPAKCKKAGKCLKSGSSKVRSYSMTKSGKSKLTLKNPKTGTRTTKTYKKSPSTAKKYSSKGTTTTRTKDGNKTKVSISVNELTPAQIKKLGLPSFPPSQVKSYSMTKGKCGSKSKRSFKAGMSIGRNMKKKKK